MSSRAPFWPIVAMIALASGVGLLAAGASIRAASEPAALAFTGLVSACLLICLALAGVLATRQRPGPALLLGRGWSPLGPRGLLLATAGLLGASQLADLVLELSGGRDASRLGLIDRILQSADGAEIALAVVGLALAPAIAEELLFRGLLLRGLSLRLGPLPGLVVSSLIFGAAHMELVHGAGAALLGLYLGGLTLLTGSIRPGVFCHAVNNLLALATSLAPRDGEAGWLDPAGNAFLGACVIALLVCTRRFVTGLPATLEDWRRGVAPEPPAALSVDGEGGG